MPPCDLFNLFFLFCPRAWRFNLFFRFELDQALESQFSLTFLAHGYFGTIAMFQGVIEGGDFLFQIGIVTIESGDFLFQGGNVTIECGDFLFQSDGFSMQGGGGAGQQLDKETRFLHKNVVIGEIKDVPSTYTFNFATKKRRELTNVVLIVT